MESEVLISELNKNSSFSDSRIICRVCQKQFSRYTCPRCNCRYCSMECYKNHSIRCTESFMQENVMDELQQVQAQEETKMKMLEILKRFHEEDEDEMENDDENKYMLSEDTIQKVLSGNEIRLEDLSLQEIKQFREAVASGELSRMIEPWTPWWTKPIAKAVCLSPDGSQLVKPISKQEEELASISSNSEYSTDGIPAGPEGPLPSLHQLSRSDPSPLLAVHLVDVLYTYCFTLRLYNGDWQCDSVGAAMMVLSISVVLGDDGRPETVAEALGGCFEQIQRSCSHIYKDAGGFEFGMGLVDDVITLLSLGGNGLICLLCDLLRMFKAAESTLKSEKMNKVMRRQTNLKLKSAERKVYFLMCWVHEQPIEAWSSLTSLLQIEKASLRYSSSLSKPLKEHRKDDSKGKVLIKDVS